MRLVLSANDEAAELPPDLWFTYTGPGSFIIAPYVANGYTKFDAYIVGKGGKGGNGAAANYTDPSNKQTLTYGGGAGGGAGGGDFQQIIGALLTSLSGSNDIVVNGTNGISSFAGKTCYGGGDGGNGSAATSAHIGHAGGGGSGGGMSGKINGANATATVNGSGGASGSGGGAGGNDVVIDGRNGINWVDANDHGGGAGGRGGVGVASTVLPGSVRSARVGGNGGIGQGSVGGLLAYPPAQEDHGGEGGNGGGGANLTALTDVPNLSGKGANSDSVTGSFPGGGGHGGRGGGKFYNPKNGTAGASGVVLIRVYAE